MVLVSTPIQLRSGFSIIISIAATFIGTVVGAGFASGQEIYQFFSAQGYNGLIGLSITVLLLGKAGAKVFAIGRKIRVDSYEDFLRFLLGKRLAPVVDLILFGFFVILMGVMFAGSGTIFAELGMGYWTGVVGTAVLLIVVLFNELPGLIVANLIIIPLMFAGAIGVSVFAIQTRCNVLPAGTADLKWLLAALQFSAYNLVLSLPVLLSLAKRYPFPRILKAGGWVGSIGLGIMAALIHLALLCHLPHLRQSPLPMIELAKNLGPAAYFGYAVILWAEMLTTLFANAFGVAQRAAVWSGWPYRFWVLCFTMVGIIVGRAGFVQLIAGFYPVFGYLSLAILAFILFKTDTVRT